MKEIIIAGVPEHFNLPWQDLSGSPWGRTAGLSWIEVPEGTGRMAQGLADGSFDIAVLLTEGAVVAAAGSGGFQIVSAYTDSPLTWGIHTPAASALATEADIRGTRYAISRPGSGSHIMSFAHARTRDWPDTELQFVEVGTLQGAIDAFAAGTADVFFWERFMTQPLVDSGAFRRLGEFSAPWPAFVVCVADALWRRDRDRVRDIVARVQQGAARFHAATDSAARIATAFHMRPADAASWLARTRWSTQFGIRAELLAGVAETLVAARVLTRVPVLTDIP